MATPAQVANDMEAHAAWWSRRNDDVARCCRDAARVIRMLLAGEKIDGRTWHGLHARLLRLEGTAFCADHPVAYQAAPNLTRARLTLEELRRPTREE